MNAGAFELLAMTAAALAVPCFICCLFVVVLGVNM